MKKLRFLLILLLTGAIIVSCKSNKQVVEMDNNESVGTESSSDDFLFFSREEPKLLDPITIEFGDFDAMFDFSKKCQNVELAEGQIVTIDGELSTFFSPPSIGQRKGDEYFGTTLEIKGLTEEELPPDRSRVKVKAQVVKNKDYYFLYLTAEPKDLTVIERAEED